MTAMKARNIIVALATAVSIIGAIASSAQASSIISPKGVGPLLVGRSTIVDMERWVHRRPVSDGTRAWRPPACNSPVVGCGSSFMPTPIAYRFSRTSPTIPWPPPHPFYEDVEFGFSARDFPGSVDEYPTSLMWKSWLSSFSTNNLGFVTDRRTRIGTTFKQAVANERGTLVECNSYRVFNFGRVPTMWTIVRQYPVRVPDGAFMAPRGVIQTGPAAAYLIMVGVRKRPVSQMAIFIDAPLSRSSYLSEFCTRGGKLN